jgi:hypothetical protein
MPPLPDEARARRCNRQTSDTMSLRDINSLDPRQSRTHERVH